MREIRLSEERIEQIIASLKSERLTKNLTITPTKLTCVRKLTIYYTPVAWAKTRALIEGCSKEIGWHGVVTQTEQGDFVVEDIIVFPQVVTGATVRTDDSEYANWLMSVEDDEFNALRLYGHSHVNMGVTPSAVDEQYKEDLLHNMNDADFYIFTIMNKAGTINAEVYDLANNVIYENADTQTKILIEGESDWYATVSGLVKEHVVVVPAYNQSTLPTGHVSNVGAYEEYQQRVASFNASNYSDSEVIDTDDYWKKTKAYNEYLNRTKAEYKEEKRLERLAKEEAKKQKKESTGGKKK